MAERWGNGSLWKPGNQDGFGTEKGPFNLCKCLQLVPALVLRDTSLGCDGGQSEPGGLDQGPRRRGEMGVAQTPPPQSISSWLCAPVSMVGLGSGHGWVWWAWLGYCFCLVLEMVVQSELEVIGGGGARVGGAGQEEGDSGEEEEDE